MEARTRHCSGAHLANRGATPPCYDRRGEQEEGVEKGEGAVALCAVVALEAAWVVVRRCEGGRLAGLGTASQHRGPCEPMHLVRG